MQIVIDIPEQDYVYIAKKHCLPSCDDRTLRKNIYEMIAKSTPLPKGHDRLIDADKLLKQSYCIDDSATLSTRDVVNEEEIDNAPTIIEADKEIQNGFSSICKY